MNFIGKILPIDGYYISFHGNLAVNYSISLTHLYQPLIGMKAIMLYQTLLHELDLQEDDNDFQTHHTLMNYLGLPLDEMYEARLKLEGIGLLNTYKQDHAQHANYLYELQSPFSPQDFFQDAMLAQLLYHHIGKLKYDALRTHFVKENHLNYDNNITASFNEVFQTIKPTINDVTNIHGATPRHHGPKLEPIDFSWMEQMLTQRMIPAKKVLTKKNKQIITQLKHLYELANHDLEKAILWALNEENELNIEELKNACHDLFKQSEHVAPIKLSIRKQPDDKKKVEKKPLTKEEKLIHKLETMSPQQLLAEFSSGDQASEQDMKAVRDVMLSQGLPIPVMNVLIHYVLLQSNMRLSKAYMEKIASHWSRANLQTTREAMEFAKKQQKQLQESVSRKKQTYRSNKKQQANEIVPEWFKKRKANKTENKPSQPVVDIQKEKDEMAAFIKKYATNQRK